MEYMVLPNGSSVAHVNAGETALLYRRIFADQCYLQHGITLSPGDVVLDVGANIGMATLFFGQYCPGVVVHAFEPAKIPFSALAENMRQHAIKGSCRQLALWERPGFRTFTYYPQTTLMSGMYTDAGEDSALTRAFLHNSGFDERNVADVLTQKYETRESLTRATTLSREIASLGLSKIDLLKLDVEKSELHVLRGMADTDWPRLGQLVAEVHDIGGRLAEFTGLLRTRGFEVAVEQEKGLEGTSIYEVFAVRQQ